MIEWNTPDEIQRDGGARRSSFLTTTPFFNPDYRGIFQVYARFARVVHVSRIYMIRQLKIDLP
jgi:hypothetical protein